MRKKCIPMALFVIYCAVMLWLLLGRESGSVDSLEQIQENMNLIPFRTIRNYLRVIDMDEYRTVAIVNIFGNILMFVPLGYFLPRLWKGLQHWLRTWAMVLLIMLAVELAQLLTLRGKFDVDDLILNLLGAAVGYVIFRLFHPVQKKKK